MAWRESEVSPNIDRYLDAVGERAARSRYVKVVRPGS